MSKKTGTYLQQVAAAILMAVFVFIHVVKLVHHHDYPANAHGVAQSGKATVKASDCPICDYHFVKHGHTAAAGFALSSPSVPSSPPGTDYLFPHLTSVGLSSSDRGPPARA